MSIAVPRACALIGMAAVFLLPLPEVGAVNFPLTWRWSNPFPHGNNIIDVAGTDGFWVQVAERGQLYTSGDLFNWTPRDSHTTRALRAVTFFRDQILISAESGTLVVGPSADELQVIDLNSSDWLEGIAASGQQAIAVGDNGAIYSSSDATHWQRQPVPFKNWLRSVTFGAPGGADTFVAVGEAGFVAVSADGAHWQTPAPLGSSDLNRVSWYNGEFWAMGDGGALFQSSNGKSWTPANSGATNDLNAFAATDSMRLVAGDGEVRLRSGRTWIDQLASSHPAPPPFATYLSGAAVTNGFLLCGRTGVMAEGVTTNGNAAWLSLSDSPRNWLWDIKRFSSAYLAVGDRATVLSSLDGINWDQELPADSATNSVFLGVGGRTNLAVVVGSAGTIMTSADELTSVVITNSDGTLSTNQVSTLGVSWDAVVPPPVSADLQGVAAFGDQLIVSGDGGVILTSTDGKGWTRRNTPTTALLSSVESFPGGLVAVGQSGTILTSADGASWKTRSAPTTNWIYRVRYANGQFVAVGQGGSLLTSTDGSTWIKRNTGTSSWLTDVQWIDNTYFVVGTQGAVLSSLDLVTWSDRGTITGKSLFGAAQQRGMLVAVGVEGVILRTQVVPFTTPVEVLQFPHRPEDNVFLFAGQVGQRFTLDRSTDLMSWSSSPVLEIDNSGTLLDLDGGTNAPVRQYFRTSLRP